MLRFADAGKAYMSASIKASNTSINLSQMGDTSSVVEDSIWPTAKRRTAVTSCIASLSAWRFEGRKGLPFAKEGDLHETDKMVGIRIEALLGSRMPSVPVQSWNRLAVEISPFAAIDL